MENKKAGFRPLSPMPALTLVHSLAFPFVIQALEYRKLPLQTFPRRTRARTPVWSQNKDVRQRQIRPNPLAEVPHRVGVLRHVFFQERVQNDALLDDTPKYFAAIVRAALCVSGVSRTQFPQAFSRLNLSRFWRFDTPEAKYRATGLWDRDPAVLELPRF